MSEIAPWDSPPPSQPPARDPNPPPVSGEKAPWETSTPSAETATATSSPSVNDAAEKYGDQIGSDLKYYGRTLAKGAANAVAAVPLMAMDAGVGARNAFGKATGMGGTDYEYPSETWHKGMDQLFGAPQTTAEKVNDAVVPMILGAGAASSGAPAAIRSVMGGPQAAEQAPTNFMTADESKRQIAAQTIKKGQDLGLVVPPQTTNPNLARAAIETVGGKIATAQAASIHNQRAANAAAIADLTDAGAVGLHPDAPLTEQSLRQVIKDAGAGYDAVRNVGQVTVDQPYLQHLSDVAQRFSGPAASFPGSKPSPLVAEVDSLLQPSFDASHAVDKIAELRDAAGVAYRQGETRLGAGYRQLSQALEDQIDRHISQNPNVPSNTVANFRASRVLAAKAHSVLDALNPATGDVSIQSLAKSGDPLTGNLRTLADFGNMAPKATQDAAKIGSHGVSHLDTMGSMLTGALGEHVAGPWGIAAGAAYPAARWGARAYALGPGQAGAVPTVERNVGSPASAAAFTQALESGRQVADDKETISRSSGGKVDEDALVAKLMTRWKTAKRQTDASTKPLLNVPDEAIVHALNISKAGL